MNSSRREFLKATALVCSAASLPAWVFEAEAAAAAGIDKNQLADIAIARARPRRGPGRQPAHHA